MPEQKGSGHTPSPQPDRAAKPLQTWGSFPRGGCMPGRRRHLSWRAHLICLPHKILCPTRGARSQWLRLVWHEPAPRAESRSREALQDPAGSRLKDVGDDRAAATQTLLCSGHPSSTTAAPKERERITISEFKTKKSALLFQHISCFLWVFSDFIKLRNPVTGTTEMEAFTKICLLNSDDNGAG